MAGKRTRQLALGIAGLSLALFCAFALPYRFPTHIPTFSHSYLAGYSNRVASVSLLLSATLVFGASWRLLSGYRSQKPGDQGLSRKYLYAMGLLYLVVLSLLGFGARASPWYYGEAGYFIQRLEQMAAYGDMPYRNFEFAYGPALLYVPLAIYRMLGPLGMPLESSYYCSLIAMMVGGLGLLFRLVNNQFLQIGSKRSVFVLVSLAMLNVTLGLNYTPVRFLSAPFLLLVLAEAIQRARGNGYVAGIAGMSSLLVWSISPEAGIAYSVASGVLLAISAMRGAAQLYRVRLYQVIPFCFTGGLAMYAMYGPGYAATLMEFSSGLGSFLIVPAPYIMFFLITLVVVVPIGLAMAIREDSAQMPVLVSFACLGMIYVGAALGRCDPCHVLWNGICVFLLGFSLVERYWRSFRSLYVLGFGMLFIVGLHLGMELTYRGQLNLAFRSGAARLLRGSAASDAEIADLDGKPDLSRLAPVGRIASPYTLDKETHSYLVSHGKLVRDQFLAFNSVFDRKALDAKLGMLAQSPYVLVDLNACCYEDPADVVEVLMLYPLKYEARNRPFSTGNQIRAYVEANFEKVQPIGRYYLYRNRHG